MQCNRCLQLLQQRWRVWARATARCCALRAASVCAGGAATAGRRRSCASRRTSPRFARCSPARATPAGWSCSCAARGRAGLARCSDRRSSSSPRRTRAYSSRRCVTSAGCGSRAPTRLSAPCCPSLSIALTRDAPRRLPPSARARLRSLPRVDQRGRQRRLPRAVHRAHRARGARVSPLPRRRGGHGASAEADAAGPQGRREGAASDAQGIR